MSVVRLSLPAVRTAPVQLEALTFIALALGAGWPLAIAAGAAGVPQVALLVPGIVAALIVTRGSTRFVLRRLALDRLGWPDAYLFALWVPVVFAIGRIAITVVLNAGQLDRDLGGLLPASGAAPRLEVLAGVVGAILFAPFAQLVFSLGSELGWRAFLLPRLLPLGTWPAITITSVVWWAWQLPLVLDPRSASWPLEAAAFFFWALFVGEIAAWLYLRARSVWAPALFMAAMSASSYLPALVLRELSPDGASPFGPAALIVPALVVFLIRGRSEGEVRIAV